MWWGSVLVRGLVLVWGCPILAGGGSTGEGVSGTGWELQYWWGGVPYWLEGAVLVGEGGRLVLNRKPSTGAGCPILAGRTDTGWGGPVLMGGSGTGGLGVYTVWEGWYWLEGGGGV